MSKLRAVPGRFDEGVVFHVRRALSWVIDYVVVSGIVSVFYMCARVFYLDETTITTGNLMLVCAVVWVLMATVAMPVVHGGQTLGERWCGIVIENRDDSPRSAAQCFVRECALKVALGPFTALLCLLDYAVLGLMVHRDAEHELLIDRLSETRVVPSHAR